MSAMWCYGRIGPNPCKPDLKPCLSDVKVKL